ncbi:hypothetical protein CEXT_24071 [Caerostris extrusa]|uniref:Uncharacterized protein n=1 Tax=Caerostris extrusa TaxID=172846 RepID=A0AAV4SN55_CAEEX|nr:hypothetical protein CEXT_24071 [Caerostris extrusa]
MSIRTDIDSSLDTSPNPAEMSPVRQPPDFQFLPRHFFRFCEKESFQYATKSDMTSIWATNNNAQICENITINRMDPIFLLSFSFAKKQKTTQIMYPHYLKGKSVFPDHFETTPIGNPNSWPILFIPPITAGVYWKRAPPSLLERTPSGKKRTALLNCLN